jgi:hypothetical protein
MQQSQPHHVQQTNLPLLLLLLLRRPLSVSMGNAIKALKLYLSKIDPAGEACCCNPLP